MKYVTNVNKRDREALNVAQHAVFKAFLEELKNNPQPWLYVVTDYLIQAAKEAYQEAGGEGRVVLQEFSEYNHAADDVVLIGVVVRKAK